MTNQNYLKLVKNNLLFNSVSESFLKSFFKPKNLISVQEGSLIFSFGDEAKEIYLILEGEVKIKFCDNRSIIYKSFSEFFGEKEVIEKTNRVSFVIANKDCKLYRIEAEELNNLPRENDVKLNKALNPYFEEVSERVEQLV